MAAIYSEVSSSSYKSGDKSQNPYGRVNVYDYWVVKIDANGNKLRDQHLAGMDMTNLPHWSATPDGGYLLVGSSSTGTKGDTDFWVIKINNSGTKVRDKYYGTSGRESAEVSIVTAPGGGYL